VVDIVGGQGGGVAIAQVARQPGRRKVGAQACRPAAMPGAVAKEVAGGCVEGAQFMAPCSAGLQREMEVRVLVPACGACLTCQPGDIKILGCHRAVVCLIASAAQGTVVVVLNLPFQARGLEVAAPAATAAAGSRRAQQVARPQAV
jgi:hypothetical protein